MSAKIATISSITWLIGWMRPVSTPGGRTGSVTSSVSRSSCASSAAFFSTRAARRERLGHRVLQRVDRRALGLALVGREPAEGGEQGGDRPLLAEGGDAHRLERGLVGCGLDRGERFVLEGGEVGHGEPGLRPAPPKRFSRRAGEGGAQRRMRVSRRSERRTLALAPDRSGEDGELGRYAAFGRWPLACSTIAAKAAGSVMASSDSTLRSTSIPAVARAEMNRL